MQKFSIPGDDLYVYNLRIRWWVWIIISKHHMHNVDEIIIWDTILSDEFIYH